MLLPRFSTRTLFFLLTLAAFASVVIGMAVRGQQWAWGVSIGLLSVLLFALVHAAWFGIVWMFTQLPAAEDRQHSRTNDQS